MERLFLFSMTRNLPRIRSRGYITPPQQYDRGLDIHAQKAQQAFRNATFFSVAARLQLAALREKTSYQTKKNVQGSNIQSQIILCEEEYDVTTNQYRRRMVIKQQ